MNDKTCCSPLEAVLPLRALLLLDILAWGTQQLFILISFSYTLHHCVRLCCPRHLLCRPKREIYVVCQEGLNISLSAKRPPLEYWCLPLSSLLPNISLISALLTQVFSKFVLSFKGSLTLSKRWSTQLAQVFFSNILRIYSLDSLSFALINFAKAEMNRHLYWLPLLSAK